MVLHRAFVATSVVALSIAGLAGCGGPQVGSNIGYSAYGKVNNGTIYTRNGVAQVLIKRRPGAASTMNYSAMGLRPMGSGRGLSNLGWQMVSMPGGQVGNALKSLGSDPSIVSVQPNFKRQLIWPKGFADIDVPSVVDSLFPGVSAGRASAGPNDPLFAKQYAPQVTHAVEAWATSTGKGVVTAIVDTGVDSSHPDLQAHMVGGWNTVDNTSNAKDDHGHGTHVAGITGALVNNKQGIAGIAPDTTLMPVKVLAADGSGSDETVANGIIWAADHGAKVINMSLGGPGESQVMAEAVAYAIKKNVAVIAAMGNDGNNEKSYPAACPGVVAVGATNKSDKVTDFSQYGDWISVSAPGASIMATFPTYKVAMNEYGFPMNYASLDGTSMATPAVAGAAAVIRAKFPALDSAQIKARLEGSADKVSGQADFDQHYGFGRINVLKAIKG